ncbi:hypothetical protein TWF696_000523 [Orbilia brochopaga]|uniref:Uncharacterized protein n=1 Tax=Orbilia brochopaga TaxID=3140254 RepID=A0AAV9VF31_9PEZI
MSFAEDTPQNLEKMTNHLAGALQVADKTYKKIVLVTVRFDADGQASAKCCKDITKAIRRYIKLPAGSAIIDLVVDGSQALTHPSGRDASVHIREEIDDLIFANQLDQISDHDSKLLIIYIVGKGAILTDPLDTQMIPHTKEGEFYAICSNEPKKCTFINYKYLIQDVFVDPSKSQFRSNLHRRLMRKTDFLLLLDCWHPGGIKSSSAARRTAEIITGHNESRFVTRFCKAFQHIVCLDQITPEPCNIYEMMIFGKVGCPKFYRATGVHPITFPCDMAIKTREIKATKALKYLDDDFDTYPTARIFHPFEISFFGRQGSQMRKTFDEWSIAVGQILRTQVGYIFREKLYAVHEHELKKADLAHGRRLTTAIVLVPFRYETMFSELHGKFDISVKPLTEEMKKSTVKVYYETGLIERKLGEWLEELDILLRDSPDDEQSPAVAEDAGKKQDD